MNNTRVYNRIMDWIMKSELESASEEIRVFLDKATLDGNDEAQDLYGQIVILASRLSDLNRSKMEGTLDDDEADERYNQIRVGLRDLAGEIRELPEFDYEPLGTFKPEQLYHKEKSGGVGRQMLTWASVLLLIGLIAGGIYLIRGNKGQDTPQEPHPPAANHPQPTPSTRTTPYNLTLRSIEIQARNIPMGTFICAAHETTNGVRYIPLGKFDGGSIFEAGVTHPVDARIGVIRLAVGMGPSAKAAMQQAHIQLKDVQRVKLVADGQQRLAKFDQAKHPFRVRYVAQ